MIDSVSPLGPAAVSNSLPVAGANITPGTANVTGHSEAGADFGAMLSHLASNAAGVVRQAEAMSIAGIQGTATVQQVVESVMAAEQTLQGAVAIRDKVVAAYLELSRMQI